MNSKSVKESDLGSISYTAVAFDCKECHKTESLWNYTTTDHKEGEQLEDRRKVGKSSCNFGDGTDQRVHYLMFMVVMMMQLTVDWGRPRHAAGYVVFLPRFEWETSRLGIWSCTAGYKFLGCWDLAAQHACCSVCCVWGAFTNLRKKKMALNLVMSVRQHGTARLPPAVFSWKFDISVFFENLSRKSKFH